MKKVLFLQAKGNSLGGVAYVNKSLAEAFTDNDYKVEVLSVRNHPGEKVWKNELKYDNLTINDKDLWEIVHKSDVIKSIKKFRFFRTFSNYVKDQVKLCKDFRLLNKHIKEYNPDYIIVSHYELIKVVPKEYLKRTIYHHHSSFRTNIQNKSICKTFQRFNNKINFLWLTKSTCDDAIKFGLNKCSYIYNPVRITSAKRANVTKNKKLITITRFSEEKRIDLMIDIVKEVFKRVDDDWIFELYGGGNLATLTKNKCDGVRIKYKGVTNDVKKELLSSSINLNTSLFEGFSLSILEAMECGIPTISFDCGESISEEILNEKTGIIVEQNNKEEYINQLVNLIQDSKKIDRLSKECKDYSKKFQIEFILKEWFKLFEEMEKNK